MNQFAPIDVITTQEQVHSLTQEELDSLQQEYNRLKALVDSGEYELGLNDQKIILQWRRADRLTKFLLVKTKIASEKVAKMPKPRKPKKLSQKKLGLIYLKELNNEELTKEEMEDRDYTMSLSC